MIDFDTLFSKPHKKCLRFYPRTPPVLIVGRSLETGFTGMNALRQEITAFLENKQTRASEARQMAALQIACHFDMAEALKAEPADRARIVVRLERMIERERQRGMRKHWSYDLNRHIALKQALDSLRPPAADVIASKCLAERIRRSMQRKRRPQAPLQTIGKSLPGF